MRRRALIGIACAAGTLSFAAARAQDQPLPAVARSGTAGHEADKGFFLESEAGDYRLRPGLLVVLKAEPRFLDGESQDRSAIFAVRPFLAGHVVWPWLQFLTTFELAQNPPFLLYAYLDIRRWRRLSFRLGQQDTLVSRHENSGLARILFPQADTVATYFWGGRDKGVTAYGTLASDRLDYAVGYYGGSPLRQYTTIAGNYVFDARLTVSPLGQLRNAEFAYVLDDTPAPFRPSFSVQGYYGKIQSATENFDADTFNLSPMAGGMITRQATAGADLGVQASRLMFFTEGYVRRTTPPVGARYTSIGAWGQVGVLLLPRGLDVAVRGSWANASTDLSDDRLLMGEAQMAWYVRAPTLIVKARYGYSAQQSPGMTALGSVTLPAAVGHLQIITLQVNLAL